MTRAAIYTRISRADNGDRSGVERHADLCRQLCDLRGYEVTDVYEDNDTSATSAKRPAFARLVRDLPRQKFDIVVAYEQSRLARDQEDWPAFRRRYVQAGLDSIEFVHGGTVSLASAQGGLTSGIVGVTNAYEREVIQQRILDKKQELAAEGKYSGGGTRPFGYEPDGVTVRDTEAVLIREAARRILEGESLYGIAKDWQERGIPTVTGATWSTMSIKRTLTRPRIAGRRQHRGSEAWEDTFEAAWPAILDRETWERVRAVLLDHARRQPPPSREYPLHRVLRCSECGHWLSAMPRSLGGGKSSRNYGCRKGLGDGRCGHVFVTAGAVEARVAEVLLPVADSSGLRDLIDEQEGDVRERAAELVVANAQDEKKLTELDDMFGDGTLPKDAYLRQANRLRERVRQRAAELQTLRGTSALSRLGGDVTGSWESMSADDKRLVAQALLMAVDVTPASRRGSNLFDPKRLRFVWRWDALLKIADDVE